MKVTNLRLSSRSILTVDMTAIGDEYAVKLPSTRITMPVFEMMAEPKSDRRYVRKEAAF